MSGSGRYEYRSLPDTIGLFPLSDALLLPQVTLPLKATEDSYVDLVETSIRENDRLIGVVQESKEAADNGDLILSDSGCLGRILGFKETGYRQYSMEVTGICRFKVGEDVPRQKLFRTARPDWSQFLGDLEPPKPLESFDREGLLELMGKYYKLHGINIETEGLKSISEEILINSMCMITPFGQQEKLALMLTDTLQTRLETLTTLMEFGVQSGGSKETIQ